MPATIEQEAEVLERPEAAPVEAPPAPPQKADKGPEYEHGCAPPKKGPCRRCGRNLPLNRLMLCYRCWTITNLEEDAKSRGDFWGEGMPHPATCGCVGLGEHSSGDGTVRGLN